MKPKRVIYAAVIGVAPALIGLYAYNVMVGLPFSGSPADGNPVSDGTGHTVDAQHSTAAGARF